jgi:hypothetical protein
MEFFKKFYIISIFIGIVFIDRLCFDFLYWQIPNESPWGENYFYNYEFEKRRKFPNNQNKNILIIGSSVAKYSINPNLLENSLNAKGLKANVKILSHAGFTPLDAFAQRKEFKNFQPDLIIYPVNYIDFRIFKFNELFGNKIISDIEERLLIKDQLKFITAPQSKHSYPIEVLLDFREYLTLEEKSQFLLSGFLYSYRYREFLGNNIKYYLDHRFSRNTSYYNYQGIQFPERVSSLGWTGEKITFQVNPTMVKNGFYIQVVPELLLEGPLKIELKCNEDLQEFEFRTIGWQLIKPNINFDNKITTMKLSNVWFPFKAKEDRFDYSKEAFGVRLSALFGKVSPDPLQYLIREERSEDLRFENMDLSQYEEYFYYRLLSDKEIRPGLLTLHIYKDSKNSMKDMQFQPYFQFRYLREFVDYMSKNKVKILLVHSPENLISLNWYKNTKYYNDFMNYFYSLKNDQVLVEDFVDKLDPQDFSDYHHLTYKGMEKMIPIYTEKILQEFQDASEKK